MYFTIEAIHNVGRPSSTSAIGLIFTPIHALFYGGVGLLTGVGLKRILLKIGVDFKTSALWLSIVSFTLISFAKNILITSYVINTSHLKNCFVFIIKG